MYTQPGPTRPRNLRSSALLAACGLLALPGFATAQATRPAPASAQVREEPTYPSSTRISEEMIRHRPRQALILPSEPGEYGEDPLQQSSGVLGKLPPDVHRLPEGYVVASQEMAVAQQPDWTVCYLPDERLMKLPPADTQGWAGDLDAGRLPAGLAGACQQEGLSLAPESKIFVEAKGTRWRVADPRRSLVVERDRDGMVVRSALPLRLLPNKQLSALETVLAGTPKTPDFAFTGRVTEFLGNNYLLIEHVAEVIEAEEPAPSELPEKTEPSTATPAPAGEPRPEDIIQQLLERKPRRALTMPQTMPAGPRELPAMPTEPGEAAKEQLAPEETIIVDQPGRVVPGDRWWTLSFENKGDKPTQRPVRLLPNRMLETAIALTGDESMGVVLLVSGEMTEYRGANYLLLRKVLVQRDWGNLR